MYRCKFRCFSGGYVDSDFVIDETILDIAGNYDAYKGAVGQVNHILVKLVNMLVSDSGEADLALTDGDNTNLYANLDKIGKKKRTSSVFCRM